jgi:hypothetical protein
MLSNLFKKKDKKFFTKNNEEKFGKLWCWFKFIMFHQMTETFL